MCCQMILYCVTEKVESIFLLHHPAFFVSTLQWSHWNKTEVLLVIWKALLLMLVELKFIHLNTQEINSKIFIIKYQFLFRRWSGNKWPLHSLFLSLPFPLSSSVVYWVKLTEFGVSYHMVVQLLLPVLLWTGIPLPNVALGVSLILLARVVKAAYRLHRAAHLTLCIHKSLSAPSGHGNRAEQSSGVI